MYLVASTRLSVHPSVLSTNITPNSAKSTLALKLVWPTTLDVSMMIQKVALNCFECFYKCVDSSLMWISSGASFLRHMS